MASPIYHTAFVRAPLRFNSPFKLPRPQRRVSSSTSSAPTNPRMLQVQRVDINSNTKHKNILYSRDIKAPRKMTFGGASHDRQNSSRTDKAYVERQLRDENARYFVFDSHLRLLFDAKHSVPALYSYEDAKRFLTNPPDDGDDEIDIEIAEIDFDAAAKTAAPVLFLGSDDQGRPYCAIKTAADIDISSQSSILTYVAIPDTSTFVSLREVASLIPGTMSALAAQARSLFAFHKTHLFCGTCGTATTSDHGGSRRTCLSPDCPGIWYPRIDPAVIMLVLHPTTDSVLLCRQPRYPPGMYSCLAGHMEHAEHIEDTVRRETHEETGVSLGESDGDSEASVRYFRSQPWPFPYSLMLGCVARAATSNIVVDKEELEDARWFSRAEIQEMVDARESAFKSIKNSHARYRPRTAFDAATKADTDESDKSTQVDEEAERDGAAISSHGDNAESNGDAKKNNILIKFVPPNMAIAGEMIEAYLARDPIFDFDAPVDDPENGAHVPSLESRRPL